MPRTDRNLAALLGDTSALLRVLGDKAHAARSRAVKHKAGFDEVATDADLQIEREFRAWVEDRYPGDGFVGEETGSRAGRTGYEWCIDPIDGTSYYIANVPMWTTTAALLHDGEPVLGVVYHPTAGQMYCAAKGVGASCNAEPLTVASLTKRRLVAWDWIGWDPSSEVTNRAELTRRELREEFGLAASYVNGSLGLVWLAMGVVQAFVDPWRMRSKFIDIAGALVIASQAGATWSRRSVAPDTDEILVATPAVYENVRRIVAKHFK